MKNKKIPVIIISVIVLLIASISIYFVAFKKDKNTTLTLLEKQWIESNKSKLIDLSIMNNVPIISHNGEGIFFDFLNDLEENTKLEFNKVAYNKGEEPKTEYALKLVDNVDANQIKLYEDDYVLVSKNKVKYASINDIKDITVGVFKDDLDLVNTYLNVNSNILLKSYNDYNTMINDLQSDGDKKVDAIVLPRLTYFKEIVANDSFSINYHITEMRKSYVLQLGSTDKLNSILTKYYQKWYKESYNKSYANQFLNNYLTFSNVGDKDKVEFKSKRYAYGFYENSPYDYVIDAKYVGINHSIISDFSDFAGIEISYKKYNDIASLVKDFNQNKLDIIFNDTTYFDFDMDVYNTVSSYDEKVVILTNNSKNAINSYRSLKNEEVMAVKETRIADFLVKQGVQVKNYKNTQELLSNIKNNSIIVVDLDTYNTYSKKELKDFKIVNIFDLDTDYNFTIRDINDNKLFAKLFDFYLSFNDEQELVNKGYFEINNLTSRPFSIRTVILYLIGLICAGILVLIGVSIFKPKKKKVKKVNLSKEDKLKYIDMLTSLKNRNYLNDNIEKWDLSEVYPQTIVVIDLNNVAYINDNYGHAEGDKVIGEAANILISTQMPNSDIIRTNGNEFLIYMVGYDEKQVVSYMRKLNKEFKGLSHGFGAAIGYSMINDAIKTVDDAINEATAMMKEVKEETDY